MSNEQDDPNEIQAVPVDPKTSKQIALMMYFTMNGIGYSSFWVLSQSWLYCYIYKQDYKAFIQIHLLFIVTIISYLIACLSNPNKNLPMSQWTVSGNLNANTIAQSDRDTCTDTDCNHKCLYKYCDICDSSLPIYLESKHCKRCDKCIIKYDHHCALIGNCIGVYNHRIFVLFLILQILILIWVVSNLFDIILTNYWQIYLFDYTTNDNKWYKSFIINDNSNSSDNVNSNNNINNNNNNINSGIYSVVSKSLSLQSLKNLFFWYYVHFFASGLLLVALTLSMLCSFHLYLIITDTSTYDFFTTKKNDGDEDNFNRIKQRVKHLQNKHDCQSRTKIKVIMCLHWTKLNCQWMVKNFYKFSAIKNACFAGLRNVANVIQAKSPQLEK